MELILLLLDFDQYRNVKTANNKILFSLQGGCQGLLDLSQHDATLGNLTNIDLFFMCTRYIEVLSLLFGVDGIAVSL